MRKRTTLLLSAAVALLSATALTAGVDFVSQREVKVIENKPIATVDEQALVMPTEVAHEYDGKATVIAGVKKTKAVRKKIAAASDLEGVYTFSYQDYYNQDEETGEYNTVENKATISLDPTAANQIVISGMWSYGQDLTATVDVENSTISIPRQLFYEYEGDTSADFVNANDTTQAVTGVIGEDGVITLQNPWGAKLENTRSYYVLGLGGTFTPRPDFVGNAVMKMSSLVNGDSEFEVLVTLGDDFTVTIENFAEYGTATLTTGVGNTFKLPEQTVGSYTTSYLDHSSGQWKIGASTITGTGTETALTFDANSSDKILSFLSGTDIKDAITSASITLKEDADITFVYPTELPGNAVMAYTSAKNGEQEIGVTVTQNDDYTVTIENFAELGTATLELKFGGKVKMPQQTVGGYTSTYLYISGKSIYIGESTITGTGDETVITFDTNSTNPIMSFISGTSIKDRLNAAKITLKDNAGFTFLYPETEPDMTGTGTEEDPFVIGTPEDLSAFIYQVNENGKTYDGQFISVVADIDASDIEFQPIGSANAKFAGTFDGGNHTIDGVNIRKVGTDYVGFFSFNAGVIKNLNLTNLNVVGGNYVGGVVGYNFATAANASNVIVENCTVDNGADGLIYGSSSVGGVVGYNQGTVRNCAGLDDAYVQAVSYTGGIVGYQMRGKIENSTYSGFVFAAGAATEATGLGGIAGVAANGSTIDRVSFTGTMNGYRYGSNTACGGILGRANGNANSKITVSNAYNGGTVYADSIAGGIVGSANQLVLSNSENAGNVIGIVKTSGNTAYAGGLIGHSLASTVENSKAGGIVQAGYLSDLSQDGVAGGLIGYCAAGVATKVNNSFSVATVAGGVEIGGIIGDGGGEYTNVYSAGSLVPRQEATVAGGFVGKALNNLKIAGGYSSVAASGNVKALVGAVNDEATIDVNANYVTDFGATDDYGTPVTVKDLAAYSPELAAGSPRRLSALDDDAAWEYGDDYTLPVLVGFAGDDDAKANAAAVVLSGDDTYDNVTDVMNVGLPEGATWSFSNEVLALDSKVSNQVNILEASNEEVTLTVAVGDVTKAWTVTLNTTKPRTAIESLNLDGKNVKSVRYFNLQGVESAEPVDGVNIIVKTMDDGNVQVVKAVK